MSTSTIHGKDTVPVDQRTAMTDQEVLSLNQIVSPMDPNKFLCSQKQLLSVAVLRTGLPTVDGLICQYFGISSVKATVCLHFYTSYVIRGHSTNKIRVQTKAGD